MVKKIYGLNDPRIVKEVKKAAAALRRAHRTKQATMEYLIKAGFLTKTGRLKKHIR